MFDLKDIRTNTPGITQGVHLNSAGASLMSAATMENISTYLKGESTFGGYAYQAMQEEQIAAVYNELSALLAVQADEIAIVGSASDALIKVLFAIPWQKGDVLLCSDQEYGNNYLNYLLLVEQFGIAIQIIPSSLDGQIDLAHFESLLNDKIKLIAITHMPTNCGTLLPVEAVGILAKRHGIPYLVDACQTVGQQDVNVQKIQCDFLTGTSRKFLRGPRGLGFLYVSKKYISWLNPRFRDSNSAVWTQKDVYELQKTTKMFELWEKPYALVVGLAQAVKETNELGLDTIQRRIGYLSQYAQSEMDKLPHIQVHEFAQPAGIISFSAVGIEADQLHQLLLSKRIYTSVSRVPLSLLDKERKQLDETNRLSIHYYNTIEEIDILLHTLKQDG